MTVRTPTTHYAITWSSAMTEREYSLQDLGGGRYRVSGIRISPTTGRYVTQKEEERRERERNTEVADTADED